MSSLRFHAERSYSSLCQCMFGQNDRLCLQRNDYKALFVVPFTFVFKHQIQSKLKCSWPLFFPAHLDKALVVL